MFIPPLSILLYVEKLIFNKNVRRCIQQVPRHDKLILIGDFNTRLGYLNTMYGKVSLAGMGLASVIVMDMNFLHFVYYIVTGVLSTRVMLRNPNYVYGREENLVPAKLNLGEFLVQKYKSHGDKVALINGATDERITYNEMAQASMNLAVSLVRIGVKKGDVVGICSETRMENWSVVTAVACTGAILTPISTAYKKDELKNTLNISKPQYLFFSMQAYKANEEVFKSLKDIKKIIFYDDERLNDSLLYKDLAFPTSHGNLREDVNFEEFQGVDVVGQNDLAFIMYSSGTTGLPKGVMITHLNVIAVCCLDNMCDPTLTILIFSPWYHAMGLMSCLIYNSHGAKTVFLVKYEMDLYLRCIEKYKANHLLLVPPIIVALTKIDLNYDVSSVQVIHCGAAILQKEVIEAAKAKFTNARDVYQGYGMTEATIVVSMNSFVNEAKCKLGSVGAVTPKSVLKVVDIETREPLGTYQNGEICIKGPLIMKGYMGKDRKDDFDTEGFLKTGDIGYHDDDGFIYIVDRLKELIKYKAYQVPPAEIEVVLLQHPGVRDVGVIGKPDLDAGELPLAFIVPQPGVKLTETELKQFVADRLSNPKHLRGGVRFVTEIPRNPTGKILRKSLMMLINKVK